MSVMTPSSKLSESQLQDALRRITPRLSAYFQAQIPTKLRMGLTPVDLLQEVYIAAFRSRSGFRGQAAGALDKWLTVIAQRTLANAIRTALRRKRGGDVERVHAGGDRAASLYSLWNLVTSPERTPSSAAAALEATSSVQIALATLSEPRRRAISMYFMEGKSYGEIAHALHRSETAVRGLLFHGLRQLRKHLGSASNYLSGSSVGPRMAKR